MTAMLSREEGPVREFQIAFPCYLMEVSFIFPLSHFMSSLVTLFLEIRHDVHDHEKQLHSSCLRKHSFIDQINTFK